MSSSTASLPPAENLSDPADHHEPPPPDPLADVPSLTTQPTTDPDTQIAALKLVADSVAQQRQLAASSVIFHPVTLSLLVLVFAGLQRLMYHGALSDYLLIGTTTTGVLTAWLLGVRWWVARYIDLAEQTGTWKWLDSDEVVVCKYGTEVIGAVCLRGVSLDATTPPTASPKKGGKKSGPPIRGVVRAWTTKQRYRGKGIGTGLLEETVRLCHEKGWTGPVFDTDHANSNRVLPGLFNGKMDRGDKRARMALERVVGDAGGSGRSGDARKKR